MSFIRNSPVAESGKPAGGRFADAGPAQFVGDIAAILGAMIDRVIDPGDSLAASEQ